MSGLSEAAVSIDAPATLVWRVMVDLEAYGAWNPFILSITGPVGRPARVDDPILLRVRFGKDRGWEVNSPERICTMEPPVQGVDGVIRARLEYEYFNWVHRIGLVRGRRTQLLTQTPGGPTEYETWERIHGWGAFLISARAITGGFRRHAKALKARAEEFLAAQDDVT